MYKLYNKQYFGNDAKMELIINEFTIDAESFVDLWKVSET